MAHREVSVGDRLLELTQREWAILECLVLNAGRLVSKDKLLHAVADWSHDLTPNAVEQYVSRLRNKLGAAATHPRGTGYGVSHR